MAGFTTGARPSEGRVSDACATAQGAKKEVTLAPGRVLGVCAVALLGVLGACNSPTPIRGGEYSASYSATTLTGTITDASLRNLSTNSKTGYVQEMAVELTVDFDWRDGRTGQYLASRRAFKSMEGFVPARPTNERIELGQHAVVQEMARQIVAELRSGW